MFFVTLFVCLCAIFVIAVDLLSPDTIRTPLKTALGDIRTKRKAKLSTVNVSDLNSPNNSSNKKHI